MTRKLSSFQCWMREIWQTKSWYFMLLPGLAWFFIFKYIPMYGASIAFKDYNILKGIIDSPWANPWYKHFASFYESPYFTQLLSNTFLISMYKLLFGMIPAILFAVLLYECRNVVLKRWVQTISYMPHFLSWVIIYGICMALLSESSGLFNDWLQSLLDRKIPFLSSTEWFRSVLIASDIWKDLGWGAIIYLAAMSAIDPTLFEAARIDGAGRLRLIWHVTLPSIRNLIILMLLLKLGTIMDAGFEQIYIMYNVKVYDVADIIDTWVFRVGLEQMNYSVATAVGLFKSVIGLVLILIANQCAKRWEGSIW
ncbi:ABC transporter permease subunit [Paenibacillus sp. HWE-109]|uniref:ABC transporter permease n=1 Tax=Paenibacillus sp. HWE-109 TaxID=1306526 RepID=UPI001EDE9C1B|nr:ABC transporter permease subunit [Paenibacillus sp. HWE-109]UKS26904.1 ABC transporter permease subunit [Paenibacillus sp. HWE-109]